MSASGKDFFSIVIPCYNRESLLPETLDSVAAQTYRPIHVIIVDNNSTDNSLAAAREWGARHEAVDFKVSVLEEREPGPSYARNTGMACVESEWMCFFDSDDLMEPDLVSEIMANREGADMIMWKRVQTTLYGDKISNMKFTKRPGIRSHLYHASAATQAFAIRTELARSSGGWDIDLPAWDDWEYGVRIFLANPRIKVIDRVLVLVRSHEDSISGVNFSSKQGLLERSIDKVRDDIRRSERRDTASLLRLADYRACVLAGLYAREGSLEAGANLYAETLRTGGKGRMRIILPLLYRYVKGGGRGASYLLDFFL